MTRKLSFNIDEKTFRTRLIKGANNMTPEGHAFAQSIETGCGTGVPDVFYCYFGTMAWLELKVSRGRQNYMRISQWTWMRALHKARGKGLLLILRPNKKVIDVFTAHDLCRKERVIDSQFKGDDIIFPDSLPKSTIDLSDAYKNEDAWTYANHKLHMILLQYDRKK